MTQSVSIQIPQDAEPGDVLTFVVHETELELEIPFGSKGGDVLEIQLAAGPAGQADATSEDVLELCNGSKLQFRNSLPSGGGEHDGTHRMPWPCGRALALQRGFPSLVPSVDRVLELGSGLGVLGLTYAASLRDHAAIIDLSDCAAATPLLEYNVEENRHVMSDKIQVRTRVLEWSEDNPREETEHFPLILGSDLLYNVKSIPALVATVKRYLEPENGCILFAVRWRKPVEEREFFRRTEQFGIQWTLSDSDHACRLGWREFGNPDCEASNLYFSQTMVSSGAGQPKSIGSITESDVEAMTEEEHQAWERTFIQSYVGVRLSS